MWRCQEAVPQPNKTFAVLITNSFTLPFCSELGSLGNPTGQPKEIHRHLSTAVKFRHDGC